MNAAPLIVQVALGERSYAIEIGGGNLGRLGEFVAALGKVAHAVIVTDSHVEVPHAQHAANSLAAADVTVDLLVIEAGEESKCVDVADSLWNKFLELGVDRKTVVVAVGGGVVGDLAGFAAATYARGLRFVQVPTTLLAQVDSSVGGKTGINLPQAKNMVGAFWQPRGVLIDTQVLETLPVREYRAGMAEVIKYGVILDAEFFEYLEANLPELVEREPAVLRYVVARCCRLKADVVEQDEHEESGLRAVLNYGHTFCHAFETLAGYGEILHGEGVAMGMMCAARLAERLGRIDSSLAQRQLALLKGMSLPTEPPQFDPEAVLEAMARDKKTEQGQLRFVLPSKLGHVEVVTGAPEYDVRKALEAGEVSGFRGQDSGGDRG